MIVTIFRSRHLPDVEGAYMRWAKRMNDIVVTVPGYVSHKAFVADDGERLTLVMFDSVAAQRAWAMHPEHIQAQRHGRQYFYAEYRVQVCALVRESKYQRNSQS